MKKKNQGVFGEDYKKNIYKVFGWGSIHHKGLASGIYYKIIIIVNFHCAYLYPSDVNYMSLNKK